MTTPAPSHIVRITYIETLADTYLAEAIIPESPTDDFNTTRNRNEAMLYTEQDAEKWSNYIKSLETEENKILVKIFTRSQVEDEMGTFTVPTSEYAQELALSLGSMRNYGQAVQLRLDAFCKCNGKDYGEVDFKAIREVKNDTGYPIFDEIKTYIEGMLKEHKNFEIAYKNYEYDQEQNKKVSKND